MAHLENLVGKIIDNYAIERHLATGGMAEVFLARDLGLKREVVLKVLLPSYVGDAAFSKRFQREAQAMARLEHPNIVQVYGTGTTQDGRPYIAMQYVRGGTLEKKLLELAESGQVMTEAYALAIARQMAAALQVAHADGVIHRDLKPSNILLDEQGKPILTDLGIAYVAGDARLTRTDMFMGTPHYMSSEQAKGQNPDARSDLYALGIVLFEMLAGQRPFEADSHYALIHQHAVDVPPPLRKIRPGLDKATYQIVDRALLKNPDERYPTAAAMAAALDAALTAQSVGATLTPSGQWTWRGGTGEYYQSRKGLLHPMTVSDQQAKKSIRLPLFAGVAGALAVLAGALIWLAGSNSAPTAPIIEQETVIVEITSTFAPPTSTLFVTAESTTTTAPPQDEVVMLAAAIDATTATPRPTATRRTGSTRTTTPLPQTVSVVARTDLVAREGPSTSFDPAFYLKRGESATLLAGTRNRIWLLIIGPDDTRGWVPRTLLRTIEASVLSGVPVAATVPVVQLSAASPTPAIAAGQTPTIGPSAGNPGNPGNTGNPVDPPATPSRPAGSTTVPTVTSAPPSTIVPTQPPPPATSTPDGGYPPRPPSPTPQIVYPPPPPSTPTPTPGNYP